MIISKHVISIISLTLGVLGSLYLSYDLLGKSGGILRILTRLFSLGIVGIGALSFLTYLLYCQFLPCSSSYITDIILSDVFFIFLITIFSSSTSYSILDSKKPPIFQGWFTVIMLAFSLILIVISGVLIGVFDRQNFSFHSYYPLFAGQLVVMSIWWGFLDHIDWIIENLPDRRLGSIGAFLTLLAFAIQLGLELSN